MISLNSNNPKAAIYFGSANFYNSYHDEIGMYIYGDYSTNIVALQAVLSRTLAIDDYASKSNVTSMTTAQSQSYNIVKKKLQAIGDKAHSASVPQLIPGTLLYPVGSNTSFEIDPNETVICNVTPANALTNIVPAGSQPPVAMTGGFRIALSPPTELWYNIYSDEIDLIQNLFSTAKKYVKISVMELYIDDRFNLKSDPVTLKLVQSITDAVKRGLHVQIITNVVVNWSDPSAAPTPLSYQKLTQSLKGSGTLQIRYRNQLQSMLHTKMYVSDDSVIVSSQHPSAMFLNSVYGSSIMFNDPTLREYYDNFFNIIWVHSNIDLDVGTGTIQTPYYNTYPLLQIKNNTANNWFERRANLVLCSEDTESLLSSCCVNSPQKQFKHIVNYEVVFSDPNLLNNMTKYKREPNKYFFFAWWYNQILSCPDGTWIYIVFTNEHLDPHQWNSTKETGR